MEEGLLGGLKDSSTPEGRSQVSKDIKEDNTGRSTSESSRCMWGVNVMIARTWTYKKVFLSVACLLHIKCCEGILCLPGLF